MTARDLQPTISSQQLAAAPPGRQVQVTFEVRKVTALSAGELLIGLITECRHCRACAPAKGRRGRGAAVGRTPAEGPLHNKMALLLALMWCK
jgi:hypothetical protein